VQVFVIRANSTLGSASAFLCQGTPTPLCQGFHCLSTYFLILLQGLTPQMVHAPTVGTAALAAQQGAAAAAEGGFGAEVAQATELALRRVVGNLMPEGQIGWTPEDDRSAAGDGDDGRYSDDDVPLTVGRVSEPTGAGASAATTAAAAACSAANPGDLLADLEWSFTITKEARQSWALLPQWAM
jgi:hypothetical protein